MSDADSEFATPIALPIFTIAGKKGVLQYKLEEEDCILLFTSAKLANAYFDKFRDSGDVEILEFPDRTKIHQFLKRAAANSVSLVLWDATKAGEFERTSRIENMLEDMQ